MVVFEYQHPTLRDTAYRVVFQATGSRCSCNHFRTNRNPEPCEHLADADRRITAEQAMQVNSDELVIATDRPIVLPTAAVADRMAEIARSSNPFAGVSTTREMTAAERQRMLTAEQMAALDQRDIEHAARLGREQRERERIALENINRTWPNSDRADASAGALASMRLAAGLQPAGRMNKDRVWHKYKEFFFPFGNSRHTVKLFEDGFLLCSCSQYGVSNGDPEKRSCDHTREINKTAKKMSALIKPTIPKAKPGGSRHIELAD